MELDLETSFLVSGYWEYTVQHRYCSEFTLSKKVFRFIFKKQPKISIAKDWLAGIYEISLEILDNTFLISRDDGISTYTIDGTVVTELEFMNPSVPWLSNFPQLIPVFKHFCSSVF